MIFNRKKIQKSFKRSYSKKKYFNTKKKSPTKLLRFITFLFVSFLVISLVWGAILYKKYIEPLPPIEWLKDMEIAEASTIYDRDWNELYKIFKENRTYIDYGDINKNMVNAIVAWEDKRFWDNPWFDIIWLTRAVIYRVVWISDKLEWTSTLSQQLMKIVYLSWERKIERKVKEIYLSYKLNKVFSKEKILELYLNKIEYWSNAFGIEQAAKTFFWTSAKDLDVLQASILASLPKGPSYYSPYNHADRLLWYTYMYEEWKDEEFQKIINKNEIDIYKTEVSLLKKFISDLKISEYDSRVLVCWIDKNSVKRNIRVDSDGCSVMNYSDLLGFLNSIKIKDWKNIIEYQTWRKDFILWRMFEDKYITTEEYKDSLLWSIWFTFEKYRENIKYPYFVMYVKEYLENKFGKEIVEKGWFSIYTTLDSDYQDKAEELVEKYWAINETKFWAKNAALVSLDNETGQILSMVWWRDYFDIENGWNNNMITSRLQPGSTFKPFVYSMAIANNPIGTNTPIYDLETEFPSYTPANFDWKFEWKMTLSTALNHSRNIPAVKMFYLAWWEKKIIDFMRIIWAPTIWDFKEEYYEKYWKEYGYGAAMALWTWLMTPLELATSYSTFANMWDKKEITPILKIVDSMWNIIEDYEEKEIKKNEVISSAQAYITNIMISDKSSRPEFWNNYLWLTGRVVAAKTGTSTKQYTRGEEKIIYPRNLWTAWYTPQITTVVWAWNTDWKELFFNWNGLEWAWTIWKDYMEYVHKDKPALNWKKPSWVKELSVSEVSWLLPSPEWFPENFLIQSLFLNTPTEYDKSLWMVTVDTLCDWKVTSDTPNSAIKTWYLLNFHSFYPENSKWEDPVRTWVANGEYKEKYWDISNIITDYNDEPCERAWPSNILVNSNIKDWDQLFIGNNYIEIAFKSNRAIKKIEIWIWENLIKEINALNKTQFWKRLSFDIPVHFANSIQELKVRVVDVEYYSKDSIAEIRIGSKDKSAPEITLSTSDKVRLKQGDIFEVTWKISDTSEIRSINLYLDGEPLELWLKWRDFSYTINTSSLSLWEHVFKIESYDSWFNMGEKEVILNIVN